MSLYGFIEIGSSCLTNSFPYSRCSVVLLNNPSWVSSDYCVSRYIFSNHAARSYYCVLANVHPSRDNGIGPNPYFVFYYNISCGTGLVIYGHSNVLVPMIKARENHVLCNNYIVAKANRTNQNTGNTNERTVTDKHTTHPIIDGNEVLNDSLGSNLKRVEGQHIQARIPAHE